MLTCVSNSSLLIAANGLELGGGGANKDNAQNSPNRSGPCQGSIVLGNPAVKRSELIGLEADHYGHALACGRATSEVFAITA